MSIPHQMSHSCRSMQDRRAAAPANRGWPRRSLSFGSMKLELLTKDPKTRARRGRLHTAHGVIETPIFMPVGTQAMVKAMTTDQLRDLKVEILLCNSYHL